MLVPSFDTCWDGTNSTIWSVTDKSKSISLLHLAFLSTAIGSNRQRSPKTEAETITEEEKEKKKENEEP